MGGIHSKNKTAEQESHLNFVDLPAVVHRKIFKYLKPWELFKLSRVSRSLKSAIASEHFPISSFFIHIGGNNDSLSIHARFPPRVPTGPHFPEECSWTFLPLHKKPYFWSRSLNKVCHGFRIDITTWHNDPKKAFLFALNNFLQVFEGPQGPVNELFVHTDRLQMLEELQMMSPLFHNVRTLIFRFSKGDSSLGTEVVEKLSKMMIDQVFLNPRYNRPFVPSRWLVKNPKNESQLNEMILDCLRDHQGLQSFWIHFPRDLNRAHVLKDIDTSPWNRTHWMVLPQRVQTLVTSENTVKVGMEAGSVAIISIIDRTDQCWATFCMCILGPVHII